MKIKLLKIKENEKIVLYKINQDTFTINEKTFKCKKNTSNLSCYLNSINYSLIDLLNVSIENNKCLNCNNIIDNNRFERNTFFTYKFCSKCNNHNILKKYKKTKCIICDKIIFYKDIIYSTCGNDNCLQTHRNNINNNIKKTHWTKKENVQDIYFKRSNKRLDNDKKLNRKYTAWNKGKIGIYSKETIEKIRNATIKQMKEGRIKKTKQEKVFEQFLIHNNIKYIYSFIYKKRQFDFFLKDYNLIIELQGDYWHANPNFWDVNDDDDTKKKLYETQKMKIKDDIIKKELINKSKYSFIEFWEYDIYNNFISVIQTLTNNFNIKLKNNN